MIVRRRWRLDGRVQGVGFRAFCESSALEMGLRGWVRNEFDGSVSIEAEGEEKVLAEFLSRVRSGHLQARVDKAEETRLAPRQDSSETFRIC